MWKKNLRDPDRQTNHDPKINAPTIVGRVNPEIYIDWEQRIDHVFGCYSYIKPKKVTFASTYLSDHALTWWDRDLSEKKRHYEPQTTTWSAMKKLMRKCIFIFTVTCISVFAY